MLENLRTDQSGNKALVNATTRAAYMRNDVIFTRKFAKFAAVAAPQANRIRTMFQALC